MFHGSTVYRRDAALEIGGYREELRCSQDYDFFWAFTEAGGAENLDEPLYHYRYRAGSVSAQKAGEQARAHRAAQVLARGRRRGEVEDVAALANGGDRETARAAFRARLKQADHLMLAGAYRRAAAEYGRALAAHPASALAWAKMARYGVFVSIPAAREVCFR